PRIRRHFYVLVDDGATNDRAPPDVDTRHQDRSFDGRACVHMYAGRENRTLHASAREDHASTHHRVDRRPAAPILIKNKLRGWQHAQPRMDRPLEVVEVEDGMDADEIHIRLIIRVERTDV